MKIKMPSCHGLINKESSKCAEIILLSTRHDARDRRRDAVFMRAIINNRDRIIANKLVGMITPNISCINGIAFSMMMITIHHCYSML